MSISCLFCHCDRNRFCFRLYKHCWISSCRITPICCRRYVHAMLRSFPACSVRRAVLSRCSVRSQALPVRSCGNCALAEGSKLAVLCSLQDPLVRIDTLDLGKRRTTASAETNLLTRQVQEDRSTAGRPFSASKKRSLEGRNRREHCLGNI